MPLPMTHQRHCFASKRSGVGPAGLWQFRTKACRSANASGAKACGSTAAHSQTGVQLSATGDAARSIRPLSARVRSFAVPTVSSTTIEGAWYVSPIADHQQLLPGWPESPGKGPASGCGEAGDRHACRAAPETFASRPKSVGSSAVRVRRHATVGQGLVATDRPWPAGT